MEIRRKVYSTAEDENGEIRLFSTADVNSYDNYEERLYSTGYNELDDLMEKAFCDGYEYYQKEFGILDGAKELAGRAIKKGKNIIRKAKRDVKNNIEANKGAFNVGAHRDLSPEQIELAEKGLRLINQGKGGITGKIYRKFMPKEKIEKDVNATRNIRMKGKGGEYNWFAGGYVPKE